MRAFRCFRTAAALAAVLAAVPASGQHVDPLRIFDLALQLPNQVMEASVHEGQPLKLTLDGTDEFELIPVMADAGREVTVAVYRAKANEPVTRRLVERLALTVGTPAGLRSHTGIRVNVERIRRASAPAPARQVAFVPARGLARSLLQDNYCCVCCGGICACGCGVVMDCGSCCTGPCCLTQATQASYERYLGVGRACETQFIATPRRAAALRTASR